MTIPNRYKAFPMEVTYTMRSSLSLLRFHTVLLRKQIQGNQQPCTCFAQIWGSSANCAHAAVAASLNNNAILVSGLATGVVGYAVGNYLGNAVYYLYSLI